MTQISFPGLPAYSAVPASLAGRAAACLLDALWVILPALLLFLVLSGIAADVARMGDATLATGLSLAAWLGAGLLAAVSFVYWAALLGRGTTPGLHALGLHLVRIGEGGYVDAPGFVRALVRAVVFTLGACILVGPFSPLFDRTAARRGWHDRVSDTRVTLATVEAATSEPEEGAWLPVDRLAPPRKPGRPASRPPVPAPAPPIRPQAAAAPVDPVSSPEAFVPKSRTTYTTPPDAAERYPFMRSSVDFDDLDRTRSAGALSQQGTVQWVLRLDTGEAFDVQGDGLIGRNPVATDGQECQLIDYADTTMSISKTHLSFGLEDGRLWLTDRRSTNGSSLIRAGSAQRPINTAVRTFVEPGDLIALGERRIWVATR